MPYHCCAKDCGSYRRKNKDVTFHKFPKNPELRERWIFAMRRGKSWTPSPSSVLCSLHFREKDFDRTGQTCRLRVGAVPTLFSVPGRFGKGVTLMQSREKNVPAVSEASNAAKKLKLAEETNAPKERETPKQTMPETPKPSSTKDVSTISNDHSYVINKSPAKMQEQINTLLHILEEKNKQIKVSQQKVMRLSSRIDSMKNMLETFMLQENRIVKYSKRRPKRRFAYDFAELEMTSDGQ